MMNKVISLEHVSTYQKMADIFPKPLADTKFSYFKNIFGLVDLNLLLHIISGNFRSS